MNCSYCDGRHTVIGLDWASHPCPVCKGTGWGSFWTPAERAGLKAMGRRLLLALHYKVPATVVLESAIKEFVQAARKVKEAK